jgi:hypothetical protein
MNALYSKHPPDPLADLRAYVERHPDALYKEDSELARLVGCSEAEVEEARRWLLDDGLEVRA